MYTTRNNFRIMPKAIGGLIEDAFQNGFQTIFGDENWNDRTTAPANIQETESEYRMEIMAPGLKKDDFKVNVDHNVLHISYDHQEQKEEKSDENSSKWLRREYKLQTFRRSFTLNDKVDISGISAKYTDGILAVTLPKKDIAKPEKQEISVS